MTFWFWLVLGLVLGCLLFAIAYFAGVYILRQCYVNGSYMPPTDGVDIWAVSNGAHTDIIVPLVSPYLDWRTRIPMHYFAHHATATWISFGWGDKGFYLDTPSWAELRPAVAFRALFRLSQSAMQVILYDQIPTNLPWRAQLRISPEHYQALITYILDTLEWDEQGKPRPIAFAGMPAYEHLNYKFFEAEGQYHLFYTCNCWANDALKVAGIKTGIWTPFAPVVFHHLPAVPVEVS